MEVERTNSLDIILKSIRANLVPMSVLWLLAALTVWGYYCLPPFASIFEPVAKWQRETGWFAAFLSRAVFCGILPGLFFLSKSHRPPHPCMTVVAQVLWCGLWGGLTDGFYRFQAQMFGQGVDLLTLTLKVIVGQFVFTPLIIAPANAVFFFWIGQGFSVRHAQEHWPHRFYRGLVLPNLISNWFVWIPVAFGIYAFPTDLQIHINGFVCSIWILMCLQLGRRSGK